MRKLFTAILYLFSASAFSQAPAIQWEKVYGGSLSDLAGTIEHTSDGGFILAGYSSSNDGDVSGNHSVGYADFWVMKADASGNIQWQKCYGGSNHEDAHMIRQTSDGGYIVAGNAKSVNGDVTGLHGVQDIWVIKLSNAGALQWETALGGSIDDEANAVAQTDDGGYVVAGFTLSNDGQVTGNHGGFDAWVVKLNVSGTLVWQKTLGGSGSEQANFVNRTSDGGCIVVCNTNSSDGDLSGNHASGDAWAIKLDVAGTIQWQKTYGGSNGDEGNYIEQLADKGYLVGGSTALSNANSDAWIIKVDSSGTVQWQHTYGGSSVESVSYIHSTTDGGYIATGTSTSDDGDVSGHHGQTGFPAATDYWVFKISAAGALQWQKSLGGSDSDYSNAVYQASDGGYIVSGFVSSSDGDVTGKHAAQDFWVVKLDAATGIENDGDGNDFSIYPNPAETEVSIVSGHPLISTPYMLFDFTGRMLLKGTWHGCDNRLPLEGLTRGVYMLTIGENSRSYKIIKQ